MDARGGSSGVGKEMALKGPSEVMMASSDSLNFKMLVGSSLFLGIRSTSRSTFPKR